MNSAKITYWIALAAFALALNGEYQHGKFPALHRAAQGAGNTLCRITTRAEHTLAMARLLTDSSALPADDLLASNAARMAEDQHFKTPADGRGMPLVVLFVYAHETACLDQIYS